MAKDFAHEYERMINGKAFVGVAIGFLVEFFRREQIVEKSVANVAQLIVRLGVKGRNLRAGFTGKGDCAANRVLREI